MNLNQITIPSLDLKASIEFYTKLGLNLIVEALPTYVRFECPDGDSTLSIHLVENITEGDRIIIYFEDSDLDSLVKNLKLKGINFTSEPEDKSWLWREAHLNDPDGNKLILYHAGINRKNPPWRVN
ncbi:MAG: VOC family protein [Flavobacteriaceae bacterium]|nr:VOC family protein [Flavobacteriaceae bacterium]